MVAKLVVIEGPDKGREFTCEGADQWILGRDPASCQFVLSDPTVSSQHLKITLKDNQYTLENLSQTNPTQINNETLKEPRKLQDSQVIRAGSSQLSFSEIKLKEKKPKSADYDKFFEDTSEYEETLLPPPEHHELLPAPEQTQKPQDTNEPKSSKDAQDQNQKPIDPKALPPEPKQPPSQEEQNKPQPDQQQQPTGDAISPGQSQPKEEQKPEQPPLQQDPNSQQSDSNPGEPKQNQEPDQNQKPIDPKALPPEPKQPPSQEEQNKPQPDQQQQPTGDAISPGQSQPKEEQKPEQPPLQQDPNATQASQEPQDQPAEQKNESPMPLDPHQGPPKDSQEPKPDSNQSPQQNNSPVQPEQPQEDDSSPSHFDTIFEDLGDHETFHDLSEDYLGQERFLLKVLSGPNAGAEFALQKNKSYVIGTDVAGADIIFNDLSVSKHHSRLNLSDQAEIFIEDLQSRNGTLVDGQPIKEQKQLSSKNMVTLGTTTFVVIDRENAEETLVHELPQPEQESAPQEEPNVAPQGVVASTGMRMIKESTFILTGIMVAVILVLGMGAFTLFKASPVERPKMDYTKEIQGVLGNQYPDIKFTYNANQGTLFLVGHVLSTVDKEELLYSLNGLPFISDIEDNVVVDEAVASEMNQVLSRYPVWRSVSMHAPQPGRFVLSGYLDNREEGAQLDDFINVQFPYVDRLVNYVVIEEDLAQEVSSKLHNHGFYSVEADLSNGEVSLSGYINASYEQAFDKTICEISRIIGVRNVNNYVVVVGPCKDTNTSSNTEIPYESEGSPGAIGQPGEPKASAKAMTKEFSSWLNDSCVINITDYPKDAMDISHMYSITGYADQGPIGRAVVIKGRILTVGDMLGGMKIVGILENFVFLEKNGLKYKIEFNR